LLLTKPTDDTPSDPVANISYKDLLSKPWQPPWDIVLLMQLLHHFMKQLIYRH